MADNKATQPKARPAPNTAADWNHVISAVILVYVRKKPTKPYKPCVAGNALKAMQEPKASGFFFNAPKVALPLIDTP